MNTRHDFEGISQREAVRRAVTKGYEADAAGFEYIKQKYGFEIHLHRLSHIIKQIKDGTDAKLQAYWDRLNSLDDDDQTKFWYDQNEVAFLLAESVNDVIEFCRVGKLESRWWDGPEGRVWLVFEFEMERWLQYGMRDTVKYNAIAAILESGGCARRVAWNDLQHVGSWDPIEDWDENEESAEDDFSPGEIVKFEFENDYQERVEDRWEPTAEDLVATDWVEHNPWILLNPPFYE